MGASTANCSEYQHRVVAVLAHWSRCPCGAGSVLQARTAGTPLLLLTCLAVWLISTARSAPEFPIPMTTTLLSVKSRVSL